MGLRDWFRPAQVSDVITEAKTADQGPATTPRRGFEIGVPAQGYTTQSLQSYTGMAGDNRTQLMNDLYEVYTTCPWAWAATNAIARTITGGGLVFGWDADDGEGDQEPPPKPKPVLQCERLLKFCNPREDVIQLLRSTIADLLVFGDAYIEVVWAAGIPVGLYTLDSPTTAPLCDPHGNITGYIQITDQNQRVEFDPHEVIHISLDSPRSGIFGVSPTFAALLPIKIWLFTAATLKETFRKGAPPNFHVDFPQSMSPTDQDRWRSQYLSRNVGPQNIGTPLMTKGGATVMELQQSRVPELLATLDQQRDVILSTYAVPPAEAGVIESGNIGGGTGEAQHRTFQVNTCAPIGAIVLEKLNFVLLTAFGIDGWTLKFEEVDLRDSQVVETIRDMRLRSGAWTLDRYRAEIGEPPVDGGNQAVLVDRQNLVLWRDMESYSSSGIAAKLKGTALEPDEPKAGKPVTLAKPEPEPVPPALQGFAGQNDQPPKPGEPPASAAPAPPGADKPAKPGDPNAANAKKPAETLRDRYRARLREALAELGGADAA